MVLVSTPLNSTNFLTWSRAIKISWAAKEKIGFIDGTLQPPADEDGKKVWSKTDQMVFAWLLNSISKEMRESFLLFHSSHSLWKELKHRFGVTSGAEIYRITREMNSIKQGDDSVTIYYGRLLKCWDEMTHLVSLPLCTCESREMCEVESSRKVVQFLMGLDECFEGLRSQILGLDPLPDVAKAYSMVIRQGQEKNVKISFGSTVSEIGAMVTKSPKFDGDWKVLKKKKKKKQLCDYCNSNDHIRDTCFKLNGYPKWYKEMKRNAAQGGNVPGIGKKQ